MRRLRRFQRVERLGATGRDLPGRGLQDRVLGSRPRPAARVRSPTLRPASAARCAQSARSAAIADRRAVRAACSRASVSRSARASASADRAAVSAVRAASTAAAQRVQVGQRVPRIARVRECAVRVVALDGQMLDPCVDGGEPRGDLRCLGAQLLVRRARAFQVLLGTRPCRRGPAARRPVPPDPPRLRRLAPDAAVAASSRAAPRSRRSSDSRLRCCSRTAAAVGVPARIV